MWYLAGPRFPREKPATKDGRLVCPNFQFTAYAESSNGFHWQLPALGLVDFEGSKQNNICRMATECAEGVAAIHDLDDLDANRRYKAFYWEHAVPYEGSPVKPINGMSVSFLGDGKDWKEHPGNPVIGQVSRYCGIQVERSIERWVDSARAAAASRCRRAPTSLAGRRRGW